MNHYTMNDKKCQEEECKILRDNSSTGRERPWHDQKRQSVIMAALYEEVDAEKAERMNGCAEWLKFRKAEGGLKLALANFCRVRMCPMCQWRRALKIYGQMSKIFEHISADDYMVLEITASVRNCVPENLTKTLDRISEGWKRLLQYKEVAAICKGSYRAIEVTVNGNAGSLWYETLHPHIHALMVVNKSYCKSRGYISQKRWMDLWSRATKWEPNEGSQPRFWVRKVYLKEGQTISEALREVCKYTVKASDITESEVDPAKILKALDGALDKRRFISLSGILKELHKKLNLTDAEDDADLIHISDEEMDEQTKADVYYIWKSGFFVEWNPG